MRNEALDALLAARSEAAAALDQEAAVIEAAARRAFGHSQETLRPLAGSAETRLSGTAREEAWSPLYAAIRAIQILERRASLGPALRLIAERLRLDPVLHPVRIALVCMGRLEWADAPTTNRDGCGLVDEKVDWRLRTAFVYCDACADGRAPTLPRRHSVTPLARRSTAPLTPQGW